jgi:hypothetical protein
MGAALSRAFCFTMPTDSLATLMHGEQRYWGKASPAARQQGAVALRGAVSPLYR